MKMVIAFVQTFMASAVVDALHAIPELTGATLLKAQGFGRGRAKGSKASAEGEFVGTHQKVRVEVVVPDALVAHVVGAIIAAARTGNPGDGKICVLPVERVIRIRTGEEGSQAI
jgi:nitrogen regulatory protein P-II 1